MENNEISYTSNFDTSALDDVATKRVEIARDALQAALSDENYTTPYSCVRLLHDKAIFAAISDRVNTVGDVDLCVVVGIGGSSLGFRAIYDALQDQVTVPPHNVFVLETVDTPSVRMALQRIEVALIQKQRVHVSLISKSGTTTETIALWRVVQPILKKHNPHTWHQQVTIITDAQSPLDEYAHEQKIAVLHIPTIVGGRYSVFSPAGLFPLMLCGVDLNHVVAGAQEAVTHTLKDPLQKTFPYLYAAALYTTWELGYTVHDTFIFSNWCATIGLWYRQLAAESLGKKRERDGQSVSLIPTVSIGSTDLHSIGQLYLSGARNMLTTFLAVQEDDELKIDADRSLDNCVASLTNHSLAEIMEIMLQATLDAYCDAQKPCSTIWLSARTPRMIGYLLQSYMLAIVYAGALLEVNPFDQPDVERYKVITRKLLQG